MADEEADAAHKAAWRHDRTAIDVGKAMRLAPTILVFRALLDGQPVPADALDQRWVRRYGL
jgi:hypothetical protein